MRMGNDDAFREWDIYGTYGTCAYALNGLRANQQRGSIGANGVMKPVINPSNPSLRTNMHSAETTIDREGDVVRSNAL